MLIYKNGQVTEADIQRVEKDSVGFIWIVNPEQGKIESVLRDTYECHPLVVDDCLHMDQRPKVDVYSDHAYLPFFVIGEKGRLIEIAIVIGENFTICISKEEIPFITELRSEFLRSPKRMDTSGHILYYILDACAHGYLEYIDKIELRINEMENKIIDNPYATIAETVFKMKRRLHKLRKVFSGERDIITILRHSDFPYTAEESSVYLSDVYDHLNRVVEEVDTFRDTITGLIDMQTNIKGDRMNSTVKTLTVVSMFFLPASFIVGLYGMNVKGVPEYNLSWGYWWVWGWIIVSTLGMWWYFKKKKWF
ncbi:magnesium/cobalt transporter CorA [Alicyclobacillus fastidiosus]|uniref:magnesium/cobalt transporter CorA n=1 Tax=Alicyclobacillus fastidiosus TaxID=392011 RepID=UPI0023EA0984|nr:magnesium/cobalt transporter CorA [Alicyclobacillus fastidiosus]GMA65993.1 magnesium transport protein CorA [Alicyclobacillus fastidiosus]